MPVTPPQDAASPHARQALLTLYATIQFAVLTVIAMLLYPGGAVYNLGSDHYLFLQNFFSDLGATVTPSGRPNLPSHLLFLIALASVGLALIQFSPAWRVIAAHGGQARLAGRLSQVLAIIAGLGFIGIAVTPWNRVLDAHNAFVRLAFSVLLLYILCLLILQIRNRWPHASTSLNTLYVLLLLAYIGILFFGPRLDTQAGLELQVAAQKVIVYASILNIGVQAFSIGRNSRPAHRIP